MATEKVKEVKEVIPVKESGRAFTGGDQGFIDLKLAEVTNINHNVKKFRFALPDEDDVSGLTITCE